MFKKISAASLLICSNLLATTPTFYAIGSLGINSTDWRSLISSSTWQASTINNASQSYSYGGTIGLNLTQSIAVEARYFNISGLRKDNLTTAAHSRQKHWFVSTNIKISPTILQFFNLKPYIGTGFNYRKITELAYSATNTPVDTGTLQKIKPVFLIGLDLSLNDNWFINLDYTHNPSFTDHQIFQPSSKLLSLGLGFTI